MNRLASVKLFQTESKVCGQCGMKKHQSHGCCHDEVKVVKMDDDQNKSQQVAYSIQPPEPLIAITSDFIVASFTNVSVANHFENHSPPLLTGQEICLQNCVFRI